MSSKKESRLDSLLHRKARQGDLEGVRQVLDSGRVHPDSADQEGTTPLMLAAINGQARVASLLLQEGADPNIRRITGVTALFLAAVGGYLDIVNRLLEAGADCDPQSQEGGTPLMASCQAGHLDVVEKLVSAGASPNKAMWDGAGPLFLAAQNGHARVLLHLLSQSSVELDTQRRDGASPLWIAAQMGHDDCVRLLLRAGAKVDQARGDGATALFKACHKGHEEVVRELLRHNPSVGTLANGSTALHAAALSGHPQLVLRLLAAGADPDVPNLSGFTALDVSLGGARRALETVTTRLTDPALLQGMDVLARSLTPDKLSALRSGAGVLLRNRLEHRSQSPLASLQTSPIRRLSIQRRSSRSPSTCPTTPSPSTPASGSPATTPKHTVHFHDPQLLKDGVLVTKVQCRMVSAREIMGRQSSPVRLAHLSPSSSPLHQPSLPSVSRASLTTRTH